MKHIPALLCCVIATSAYAGPKLLPPEEYDHPYAGKLKTIVVNSQADVRRMCPGIGFNLGTALACTTRHMDERCTIVVVPDAEIRKAGYDPAFVMRHEIAHCNGWPPDHRGAR